MPMDAIKTWIIMKGELLKMEGYYTDYSFVVIETEDPMDDTALPAIREFVSYEEACEYYGEDITVIER